MDTPTHNYLCQLYNSIVNHSKTLPHRSKICSGNQSGHFLQMSGYRSHDGLTSPACINTELIEQDIQERLGLHLMIDAKEV